MNINPPAAVSTVDGQEEKDVKYWDNQAIEADLSRSNSSIEHAEALYEIRRDDRFTELGYQSLAAYCFDRFGKSKSWTNKLVSMHEKFVIQLGKTKEELKEVGFGKVSKLTSIANIDNVDTILEDSKKMTQKEIDDKIKMDRDGLEPNETKVDEETITMKFKMPLCAAESIRAYLNMAAEEYVEGRDMVADNVLDFQKLELMAVVYGQSRDITGDRDASLNRMFKELELKYNISINWSKEDMTDETR